MARALHFSEAMKDVTFWMSGAGLLGSLDDGRITFDISARRRGARRDPVCGRRLEPGTGFITKHRGVEYRFCSGECRHAFAEQPERYRARAAEDGDADWRAAG